MSGFEVVGVVLGALPVLVSAIQACAEGTAMVHRFRKYKLRLDLVIQNFETESVIFRSICELLLDGLVYDPSQLHALLAEPKSDAWGDLTLQQKIKGRLGESFRSFQKNMDDIGSITEELSALLQIGADEQSQLAETSRRKRLLHRLQLSFKDSPYDDLIKRFKDNNNALMSITNLNRQLEPGRARRGRKSPNFKGIRGHAVNLHQALTQSLRCKCKAPHSLSLRLEYHSNRYEVPHDTHEPARTPSFRVMFSSGSQMSPPLINRWGFELADVLIIHKVSQEDQTVKNTRRGHVRWAIANDVASTETRVGAQSQLDASHPQIHDLCTAIKQFGQLRPGSILGCIGNEFNISKPNEFTCGPNSPTRVSLSEVLSRATNAKGVHLRPFDRLHLAVALASSLLQLHPTPWIPESWKAENIYFVEGADESQLWEPFLEPPRVQSRTTTRDIPIRNLFMHDETRNRPLFDLGVMLIELCFQEPFSVLRERCRSRGIQDGFVDSDSRVLSQLVMAVRSERSNRYGDAVEKCIYCNKHRRTDSLSDEDFCKFVYYEIVSLLETDLREGYMYTPDDTIAERNSRAMNAENAHIGVDNAAEASSSSQPLEAAKKEADIISGWIISFQTKCRDWDVLKMVLVAYTVSSLVLVLGWWLRS